MVNALANIPADTGASIDELKPHRLNFGKYINHKIIKPDAESDERYRSQQVNWLHKSDAMKNLAKLMYSTDHGLSQASRWSVTKDDLNESLKESLAKYMKQVYDAVSWCFYLKTVEPIADKMNDPRQKYMIADQIKAGFTTMLKFANSFARLAIELTADKRPSGRKAYDDKAWTRYGHQVAKVFRDSYVTFSNYGKLAIGPFIKHLEYIGSSHRDQADDNNPEFCFKAQDFELYDFSTQNKERKGIFPKLSFIVDFINVAKKDPFAMFRRGRLPVDDMQARGCTAFKVRVPKIDILGNDGKQYKVAGKNLYRECFDWMARIYEDTLFSRLKDLPQDFWAKIDNSKPQLTKAS